jgi:hypothetical protein
LHDVDKKAGECGEDQYDSFLYSRRDALNEYACRDVEQRDDDEGEADLHLREIEFIESIGEDRFKEGEHKIAE